MPATPGMICKVVKEGWTIRL